MVELGVDPRRRAEAGMLQGILMRHAVAGFQDVFSDPEPRRRRIEEALGAIRGAPPDAAPGIERFLTDLGRVLDAMPAAGDGSSPAPRWEPLHIETREVAVERRGPANAFAVTFPQGILWGILGCAATFSIGIVRERTRGTLVRLQMAPLTRGQVLLSKGLACFATILGVQLLLLVVARLAFGVRPASLGLLGLAVLSVTVAFVGLMMLFSVLGKTEEAVGGLSWAANVVLSMIGGGMMPLFLMPGWMQVASHASPVKWAILALEGALWRGFSPLEMLLPCGILMAAGAACFALGARAFRSA
jgi:ABC-2 type transport system permease protein